MTEHANTPPPPVRYVNAEVVLAAVESVLAVMDDRQAHPSLIRNLIQRKLRELRNHVENQANTPADDVREALTRSLTGGERLTPDEAMQYANAVTRAPGRMTWGEALRHFATWMREHDARLVAEVRPRGTVTDAAHDGEALTAEHYLEGKA